jgi:hypothetical protein
MRPGLIGPVSQFQTRLPQSIFAFFTLSPYTAYL